MATALMGQVLATVLMEQALALVVLVLARERAHVTWEPGQALVKGTTNATRKTMGKSLGAVQVAWETMQTA